MRKRLFLGCLLLVTGPIHAAAPQFDGKSWWATVKVLADDRFEGRNTGSPGERAAQDTVVARLKALGIRPAGSDGYFQPIDLKSRAIDESRSSIVLIRDGQDQPLTLGREAYFSTRIDLAPFVAAPLVFVGYGLKVPEQGYDDYAGLDLKGKIAVTLAGSPEPMTAALGAHYSTAAERWKALQAAGAIGVLALPNPASMDIPWSRMTLSRTQLSMALVGAEFNDTPGELFAATFNPEYADLLFAGSGHTFAEIAALAKDRKPLPRFALPVSIRAKAQVLTDAVHSNNLVAVIPGQDPKLRSEYVVLSAHLDHLGIGQPINGDRIYNGAMDNASGAAMLLDVARALQQNKVRLRRSVLFVWVTGEEKGLLGSRYFATRPTVPPAAIVADLNTDMFLPIVPLKILTVYGLAESDLGERVSAVATHLGLAVQADPEPLRNSFVRSDQYSFIKQGVPSLAMKVGFVVGSPEEPVFKKWLTERYHAPSDDLDQPVDIAAAGRFEEVMFALTVAVANDPARPAWKGDSFFKRFARPAS
jgi:Zn-dependent M28 family amino/carboxypeptidase